MRIYVEQYGFWWSFNEYGWETMLRDMLLFTVDFDDYGKPLKGVPYDRVSAYRTKNSQGYFVSNYFPKKEDIKIYSNLCDWNEDEIKAALNEIEFL